MRTGVLAARLSIALVLSAGSAAAQPRPPVGAESGPPNVVPSRPWSLIDFGVRGSAISGDAARFQRFRDLRDGPALGFLRFNHDGTDWAVELGADQAGWRDQRYFAEVQSRGRINLVVEWDQIPLFISQDTRTVFITEAPGVLRIDDAIQQGIQEGTMTLEQAVARAFAVETRNRRDTARLGFTYSPSADLDVTVRVSSARREGNMPWGGTFGLNNAVEVPGPIDTRTTDLALGVEWGNQQGMLRVGYDGSWFGNNIDTLVWDNPRKFTDSTHPAANVDGLGGSQGRLALWPASTRHAVSTAGSIRLPHRSRLTGSVALGSLDQNEPLLPHTINTAIPQIPPARGTAEAQARTLASTISFTSRPVRTVWLNARYRFYEFDNRTPPFPVTQYVRADQNVNILAAGGPEPFNVSRHRLDANASFTVAPFTALKVGYGREHADRTFRVFDRTVEDIVRASLDTVGHQWFGARVEVERAGRRGRGLDLHVLELVGEQPGMRHYDVATRDRTRATGIVTLTPLPLLGFSASAGVGRDDYRESEFGLQDNDHHVVGGSVDVVPGEGVALSLSYNFERYEALQHSRQAAPGPQFEDPARDWSTDSSDRVHTFSGGLDLLQLWPRTELRLGYDLSSARATYIYRVAAPVDRTLPLGSPVPPGLPAPEQLPPVTSELYRASLDGRYYLTPQIAIGLTYWYEQFRVRDFALGPERISRIDLPGGLLLGYLYRSYTAHTGWVRIVYFW